MPVTVRPTSTDVKIADMVSRYTNARTERASEALTWGADEHILCGAAALWWIYARGQPRQRRAADHVLVTTVAATVLPHLLKRIFNQRRPDRLTVIGHVHGVPISGKALDAFPSGHAIHMGAAVSAASELPRGPRLAVWGVCGGLALTRIVLLAHWTSDVVCGFAAGVLLERMLRRVTGYGRKRPLPHEREAAIGRGRGSTGYAAS